MKQSQLFTKTRKDAPKDEVSKNAQLLIRAGYINKEMAGVYDLLPLGLRVFNNIVRVIREEMNKIGGQEIVMSTLQRKELWEKTDRWSDEKVDVWFKTNLKTEADADGARGKELGLAPTHEEPVTNMLEQFVSSYKNLPFAVYQFQNKFRNEKRAKSGIMRTREFVMKDMYSFSRTEEEFRAFYETAAKAYATVFARVGLGEKTYRTFASGGSFSKFSDEYQTLSDAGEDVIYVHEGKKIAVNKEVYTDEILAELGLKKDELVEKKAIEVGNIFPLSTRFSEALNLKYKDEGGKDQFPIMGCYGIGPARVMGTVAELLSDDKGLVWPESIAPFRIHLIELSNGNADVANEAGEVYKELTNAGIEVLWDDRDARAGEKFADSDLLGLPWRVVVSEKTIASGKYECVERSTGKVVHVTLDELLKDASS